ncbi:hypothetical protein TNCV_284601 [Trichonephila clavipes]|uniref:Uncharacterized protein n=1 Tax=Trichonephila clavipes TaxID=2585209 RepID=A0A8X6SNN6_TRICX|nr:hypothetical protein TNCV_284601 [Trichonephila clavipes]
MVCLTQKGSPYCYYPSLVPDPQICLQSSLSGNIWDGELASHEFERTRVKVTENMERNFSRHHTEPVCLNARSYRIVHSR